MATFYLSGNSAIPDMANVLFQEINGPTGVRALFLLILATILLILLLYSNVIDVEQEWRSTAHAHEANGEHDAPPEQTDDNAAPTQMETQ